MLPALHTTKTSKTSVIRLSYQVGSNLDVQKSSKFFHNYKEIILKYNWTMTKNPHQNQSVETAGKSLEEATSALILIHGRGATAKSILTLSKTLAHPDFTYLAPQAANNSWYPYRFIAPIEENEPGISSGMEAIDALVQLCKSKGISSSHIVIGGFSQGACLASEYAARNPDRYGGLLIFSGGLIGPPGTSFVYEGSLLRTPVFIGCDNRDMHIPVERVEETAEVLHGMEAIVDKRIYQGMGAYHY